MDAGVQSVIIDTLDLYKSDAFVWITFVVVAAFAILASLSIVRWIFNIFLHMAFDHPIHSSGKSIEQINEEAAGWEPGYKQFFDQALLKKDKASVSAMINHVPIEYRARFSNEISSIMNS